jgi:hypothetical protein
MEYLKQAPWNTRTRSDEVTRTVTEMLLTIELA